MKIKRIVRYVIVNSASLGLLIAGAVYGVLGAERLFTAMAALYGFAGLLMICVSSHVPKESLVKYASLPTWLFAVFEVSQLVISVWHGWWLASVCLVLGMWGMCVIDAAAEKARNSEPVPKP